MSRKLKVHVVAGKGLMAKAKTTSSPYVEVRSRFFRVCARARC